MYEIDECLHVLFTAWYKVTTRMPYDPSLSLSATSINQSLTSAFVDYTVEAAKEMSRRSLDWWMLVEGFVAFSRCQEAAVYNTKFQGRML